MLFPQLGKAGIPYAKSVPNLRVVHGSQPDPGDLFDRMRALTCTLGDYSYSLVLLARDETDEDMIRDSNLGISSMLLYHATIIIHGKSKPTSPVLSEWILILLQTSSGQMWQTKISPIPLLISISPRCMEKMPKVSRRFDHFTVVF